MGRPACQPAWHGRQNLASTAWHSKPQHVPYGAACTAWLRTHCLYSSRLVNSTSRHSRQSTACTAWPRAHCLYSSRLVNSTSGSWHCTIKFSNAFGPLNTGSTNMGLRQGWGWERGREGGRRIGGRAGGTWQGQERASCAQGCGAQQRPSSRIPTATSSFGCHKCHPTCPASQLAREPTSWQRVPGILHICLWT